MKNKTLILGIGQAGSNMAIEFKKLGYSILCINSSAADLDTLDLEINERMHIKNGEGTAKDRTLSKQLAKTIAKDIVDVIVNRYADTENIHILSSAGGGTGGGSVAVISNMLALTFTNKRISTAVAFPSTFENFRLKNNAVEVYTELVKIQEKVQLYIISNAEKKDKFEVNKEHAATMDAIYNLETKNIRGTLDRRELAEILDTKGLVVPFFVKRNQKGIYADKIDIYRDSNLNANLTVLSLFQDLNQQEISRLENLKGINISNIAYKEEGPDFAFYLGMPLSKNVIEDITIKLSEEVAEIKKQREEVIIEEDTIDVFNINFNVNKSNVSVNKQDILDTSVKKEEAKAKVDTDDIDIDSMFIL